MQTIEIESIEFILASLHSKTQGVSQTELDVALYAIQAVLDKAKQNTSD
ncbi:hypothetical protein [Photobacterium ganghwense]|nr:hypothetical protein [Photobacterium ganghwense]MBV1843372.1 hypothetical protein [Photobacterium ganghwense]